MGKIRFLIVLVAVATIVTAFSLPAAAQSNNAGKGPPPKGAKAAPPHGPVTGGRPGGPGPAARQAYPGRPGYAGRPGAGRPVYFARHPGFARRAYGGHFYRGALAWDRGAWRHEMRNGRYGWWWDVGGAWYFYPQPVYPYPTVISDVEALEDPAMADAPPLDEGAPPPGAYDAPPPGAPVVVAPAPVVVAPAPVIIAPPPVVCVGPLCVR
ncbi:MAG TPA: hypothetical protein VK456_08715 [Xanthobacteraceae bacterium]|nr:hypothetical protein [Xanthobacteraceae bacterium]